MNLNQPFVCLFCKVALPEPADYDQDYQRCACGAVYGFEDPTDGFEFACSAADMLDIPDGDPTGRIAQIEIQSREFDVLRDPKDPDDPGEEVWVFFARLRQ